MDRLTAERHAIRGQEIVTQQRDLIAKMGEVPQALALLKTFEGLLALYEKIAAAYPPAAEVHAESAEETNWGKAARIMEILREAGYNVEPEKNFPLH
jgi:hypothetical protein